MRASLLLASLFVALTLTGAAVARDHTLAIPADAIIDPQAVLPPPPAPGSAQAAAELAELHAMQARRTPAEMAAAEQEGDDKSLSIFSSAAGHDLDPARLPATAHLLDLIRTIGQASVGRGKVEFRRPRPWIVDPTIVHCTQGTDPLSSYPSGHATFAYSEAGVLAQLIPARRGAILARAAHFAESRIVCEQHFRSDVTAGEALGLLIAEQAASRPELATAYAAARRELTAAGV